MDPSTLTTSADSFQDSGNAAAEGQRPAPSRASVTLVVERSGPSRVSLEHHTGLQRSRRLDAFPDDKRSRHTVIRAAQTSGRHPRVEHEDVGRGYGTSAARALWDSGNAVTGLTELQRAVRAWEAGPGGAHPSIAVAVAAALLGRMYLRLGVPDRAVAAVELALARSSGWAEPDPHCLEIVRTLHQEIRSPAGGQGLRQLAGRPSTEHFQTPGPDGKHLVARLESGVETDSLIRPSPPSVTVGRVITNLADPKPLPLEDFWQFIELARAEATPDRPFASVLVDTLAASSQETVLAYELTFTAMHGALYRWDVWAAAYLIGGGCSDDSFMDFRAGVIAQGRFWYERVLAAPDGFAEHPVAQDGEPELLEEVVFDEETNYAAFRAFSLLGGSEAEWESVVRAGDDAEPDMGEDFDFDDDDEMRRRLPALAALFLDLDD
ncbi:DUF4240 domain-containing protein [Streptomyces albipurpureus]|uniref:DUF4240 domain-containing protein n=1 Tax=Streptomyces albipurpureus TaxID=2897419 RepID=A0ABT0UZ73_9ACTN|nr:DUF4240 domain-containing protein [Streptomyces sp. CWNU-1]MCM2393873.1 DUF4240 domain-containing protein [Streptomyces sp. CWNU-1]